MPEHDTITLVKHYLRAQNLEQIGRVQDAIEHYEAAVTGGFDSTGPYDRLIALYTQQARHSEVERVCGAALDSVRTYPAKRSWYESTRSDARRALAAVPKAVHKPSR